MLHDDPHAALRDALLAGVLEAPGHTDPAVRRAAADNQNLPASLAELVAKIHAEPHRITDEEAEAACAQHDDDSLFEIIVAAALGASSLRLQAGLRALEDAT